MSTVHVSVVIPTYNYGRYVTEAVDSVLGQSHTNREVIVVDDGSTDDTRERLMRYGGSIRYIYQENRGLSAARNTGIRNAKGQWIAFLDSDDLWHPRKLEIQLDAVQRGTDLRVIGCARAEEMWPEPQGTTPSLRTLGVLDFLQSYKGISGSSAVVRRDCFEVVGLFDETLRSCEDRHMWLRLATRFACAVVDWPGWWYRPHSGQMSRDSERMYRNYRRMLDLFFANHPEHAAKRSLASAYAHLDASHCFYEDGDTRRAINHLMRSICHYPWQIRGADRPVRYLRAKLLLKFLIDGPSRPSVFRAISAIKPRLRTGA